MEQHTTPEASPPPASLDAQRPPGCSAHAEKDNSEPDADSLRARRGRRSMFEHERATYTPLIAKLVATNMSRGARLHDAQDAQQMALLGLFRAQNNGSDNARRVTEAGAEELHAFIGRANSNAMISIHRNRTRRSTTSIDALQQTGNEQGGVYDGWQPRTNTFEEQLVEGIDLRRMLPAVLADLPQRQRTAACLGLGGLDHRGIAEEMSITAFAANSLRSNGLKRVRRLLQSGAKPRA